MKSVLTNKRMSKATTLGCLFISALSTCCCKSYTPTAYDTKHLSEFHQTYNEPKADIIQADKLSLYVDYSTCIASGQNSAFFSALIPSFAAATKEYYSIKGSDITKEEESTFQLLRTIEEVNYADLKSAVEKMANGKSEAVLLTDGEYYQQNIAKANINNPYMSSAFKTWLMRGHDIYIISEPYVETHNGKQYNKKRFYMLFTDSRLPGNIYSRIMQTVRMDTFPEVQLFHLSAERPTLLSEGEEHSKVNPLLTAKVEGFGNYEIQDWPLDWENSIEPLMVNAADQTTGNPLEFGEYITKGIKMDRNSMGYYRVESLTAKVYNINDAYTAFYEAKEQGAKPNLAGLVPFEATNFIIIDEKEFTKHGEVVLHFDTPMYDPSCLNGDPYNYLKIDLCVNKVSQIFDQHAQMFTFESIDVSGANNVSVAESIRQCMQDPNIQSKVNQSPIYSFYIKTFKR